jgi:uncharacterized LabA/DUF88 family protein
MRGRIAILIDGGFFLKRLPRLVGAAQCDTPEKVVNCIRKMCRTHIKKLTESEEKRWQKLVYRIFFYDAQPYDGKAHHPIKNCQIDFGKSDLAQNRLALFDLLRKERQLALRLGKVTREHDWAIDPALTKKLLRTRQALSPLAKLETAPKENGETHLLLTGEECKNLQELHEFWQRLDSQNIRLGLRQKGVDMRIGIDISSLTLKKLVDTIILVSGDSDFVPAAKLARREGVEFILDPLWQNINTDLFEHIDGLQSGLNRPDEAENAAETE